MKNKYCVVFNEPKPITELDLWPAQAGRFDLILGHSLFGDLFLMDSSNDQLALLYVMPPELNEMQFFGRQSFANDCLEHEIIREDVLCEEKVDKLEGVVGILEEGEVYIPEPYPFLGGDLKIESYSKGQLMAFLSIIGTLQLE
ncbi:T6SS immunity protein Tdi1 domain-containing protein [Pseudoteredinibacter isoporae]|uniref:T6SS immunity protein Tdi1 C-terminal domain-containing protein n=1 Tax=Pseudoteredinibacter isoporae TaxID=570281 RepID=A0A7X0MXA8_9GAMM|nr:T6SS immunity protein Tdi1 domain-containing protein [Pseudoteredinibacter isoporae]MBB6521854.1 hypothetical protein [Pseudoteredinibacter isoporae]NHO87399.1 DUF1851 domain-containing protein [Pseudoteredinibacter isoporae]NIB22514.1 DUF1851 domain-containing protein [Pseudoteredinibacter isoporae]